MSWEVDDESFWLQADNLKDLEAAEEKASPTKKNTTFNDSKMSGSKDIKPRGLLASPTSWAVKKPPVKEKARLVDNARISNVPASFITPQKKKRAVEHSTLQKFHPTDSERRETPLVSHASSEIHGRSLWFQADNSKALESVEKIVSLESCLEKNAASHAFSFRNGETESHRDDTPSAKRRRINLELDSDSMFADSLFLTDEQHEILGSVRSPSNIPPKGIIVKVTSGAGSGKTTTLIHLANELVARGHNDVTYLTFNRNAVAEAKQRIGTANERRVRCYTIDGFALKVLRHHYGIKGYGVPWKLLQNEEALIQDCLKMFKKGIELLLYNGWQDRTKEGVRFRHAKRRIAMHIIRTLQNFLVSVRSEENGFDPRMERNTHYLARRDHKEGKYGLKPDHGDFYTKNAKRLWYRMKGPNATEKSFLSILKECQLSRLRLETNTAILVDEAQDNCPAQTDWIRNMARKEGKSPAAQLYFVGDAAQAIYSFRKASSRTLMELHADFGFALTSSFRFGPLIASVANSILFVKQHSPQRATFRAYRVNGAGGGGERGRVFKSVKDAQKHGVDVSKRTVLAWKNVTLMRSVLPIGDKKILINCSDGASSGTNGWKKVCSEIGELYKCWEHSKQCETAGLRDDGYPLKLAPEFKGESRWSWDQFRRMVDELELREYMRHIHLIEEFQHSTMKTLQEFRKKVLDQQKYLKINPEQADIVLSTIHAAKGMEWDTVELLNDLQPLARFAMTSGTGSDAPGVLHSAKEEMRRREDRNRTSHVEFRLASYGSNADQPNMWYVAVTRAKRTLILSEGLKDLYKAMRRTKELTDRMPSAETKELLVKKESLAKMEKKPKQGASHQCENGRGPNGDSFHEKNIFLPPFTRLQEAHQEDQVFGAEDIKKIHDEIAAPMIQEICASGAKELLTF
mmetsp:Transcript_10636/g.20558  ORF Transcript_10636/g.20558 Transcript_10636/m.20558 type:complete len:916 (-) Transcript_10636:330-3077(-)|eukprot:CAMPEP_0167776578 /NCGR_PEP_ID=MMETSP0111_2-20121227/3205_1 /TAXON_ID=91324 /ORGANISM="Lotharella globosa, Strain CCCM811" /LENGTH=915 /DNA_ID=CAMNT_0007666645 /DNA_START=88 /DNA_END=2835 /DNA_ORIENTATION=+